MATDLVVAPLVVALATAILTLAVRFDDRLQRALSLGGGLAYLAAVAALFDRVVLSGGPAGRTLTYEVGAWRPPFGIVLVADPLSAFMLGLAALVALPAVAFSVLYVEDYGQRLSYHSLFHFMLTGVSGAFLTGDVFNLFVWFEVMLMSSYVLVAFHGGPQQTRATLRYVMLNLAGSAVMLLSIGGLYATTGTLNMADLARRLAEPAAYDVALVPTLGLSALLFCVFALKAGIVPFQFWVPEAYRAAPAPATAMLAAVVKKVGIYALIRLYFTVFAAATLPSGLSLPGLSGSSFLAFFGPVLFVMALASMLFGGLAATGRENLDELLAYSSIGQVGFIALPLAVGATVVDARAVGIVAALVYSLNHALSKGLLFLLSGTVRATFGTVDFDRLGGLAPRAPVLSTAFLIGGLSLVGIPPLLGFFGKLFVFRTAVRGYAAGAAGTGTATLGVLVGAVLTIAYVSRAWNRVFWGAPTDLVTAVVPDRWSPALLGETATDGGRQVTYGRRHIAGQVTILVALAVTVVALGVGVEFVVDSARAGAEAALDTERYVRAVDPPEVTG